MRVLKDGGCTILFNAFLQGKCATQTVSGGNTEEVYQADQLDYEDTTQEKTMVLYNLHPDVVRVVKRYGRWHHDVNYDRFQINKLRFIDDFEMPKTKNNYGMKLVKKKC